jgi:hypothetical protein
MFTQQGRNLDLGSLFNVAARALSANQSSLNQADTENQNHGDNMVQVFNMISHVMANQQGGSPSHQLNEASQYLAQHGTSGSAQVYSQGLAQAAQQLQGQSSITPDNAMTLIQGLLGGGQSTSQAGDLLGSLLGGGQPAPQSGDQQDNGLDLGDILNAGMTFMNAKQQGQNNMQAALSALMAAGPMGQKPHRQQSGQLVANALLQAVAAMGKQN